MKTGTKSLLFGVHQVALHPLAVLLAWRALYGWPNWRELPCIVVHDWGYFGLPNMDGPEGRRHPLGGAKIAGRLLGCRWFAHVALHSRHYAKLIGCDPSPLCWADKLAFCYVPRWLYLWLARRSGELAEYRAEAARAGLLPAAAPDEVWHQWYRAYVVELVRQSRERAKCPVSTS